MTGKRIFCLQLLAGLSVGFSGTLIAASGPDILNPTQAVLTVGCVNCGEYEYTDGVTPKAAYAANWKRLFAENPADIWFKEDTVESRDPNKCIEAVTVRQPVSNDIVTMIGTSPEGTTARRYVRRLAYKVADRRIAFYGVHLVAESHISKKKGLDGMSPSQRLRQRQFAELIEDARKFDDAVFAGDFNAQEPWEYEIFRSSGYACANCSERFGTEATLRDIPADNIIVSSGLLIEKFDVLKTPKLDTDHFPLVARLTILRKKSVGIRAWRRPCREQDE